MNSGHESSGTSETRRDFIKKTATAAVAISSVGFLPPTAYGQDSPAKVALVTDRADKLLKQPPVQWAIGRMQDRLKASNSSTSPMLAGAPLAKPLRISFPAQLWKADMKRHPNRKRY